MKWRLLVRVKDSTTIFTGDWYNTMLMGQNLGGIEFTMETDVDRIEYTFGNPKNCFKEMAAFATSFNKRIQFLKQ